MTAAGAPLVEVFGDSAEVADELIGLVLRGVKTATASLVADYTADDEALPTIGQYWVACDGTGVPRVILRTVELRIAGVDSVDDAFAWDEGEQDRSRRSWLEGHERLWRRRCVVRGEDFSLELEAVFERFQLLWPPASAEVGVSGRS